MKTVAACACRKLRARQHGLEKQGGVLPQGMGGVNRPVGEISDQCGDLFFTERLAKTWPLGQIAAVGPEKIECTILFDPIGQHRQP